ncbi:hypothetical protein BDR05DRAFT_1006631 [Suillus weaverae]|nr:hypothetical protein BDR05DRAFT_1006631 [Suillus weaverae]
MPYLLTGNPLDELYLGLNDEIKCDSVSSGPPGMVAATPDQSPLAQSDHPDLEINPALYLGPEDDVINIDELPDLSDVKTNAPGPAEESMISNEPSTELQSDQPELSYKDLLLMVRDFQPWGSYEHKGLQSIQDRLKDYTCYHGNLPDPSIQQLLKAE